MLYHYTRATVMPNTLYHYTELERLHSEWMYYEAAERGYNAKAAASAKHEYMSYKRCVELFYGLTLV